MPKVMTDQRSEFVPSPTLEGMKSALRHLCEVNHKIVEFLQSEYKKKMTLQCYIGEAVLYELLCQSYGVPEYTTEESHKRLLSVILGAMKNHQNRPACSLDAVDSLEGIWSRPDDPHGLETIVPDTGTIRLRKIVEDAVAKEAGKEKIPLKSFVASEVPSLTQLWEQPTGDMKAFNQAFKNGGRDYIPQKPDPATFKTYDVQVNGKLMGNFKSDPNSVTDKDLQQNALNIAMPVIKRRRKKIKKVIRSGLTWNFVI